MTTDWRAHIVNDWSTLMQRVVIYRHIGGRVEVITGFTEQGDAIATDEPADTTSDFPGLRLPTGALEAIAESVKPGPPSDALARLQEALDLERRRVDDVLAWATGNEASE